jgi:radical SAM superfamily enzyme YgiQ (UPF0313 family)
VSRTRTPSRSRSSGSGLATVLVFPNTRAIAFASLGFLEVYGMLAERHGCADISYLPEGDDDDILSPKQGLLLGRMSRAEVGSFDIVAFSLPYENDFVHVPELLLRAGIPPLARDRTATFPLVAAGGFTMSSNPLPVADFMDFVVVGEAEAVIDQVTAAVETARLEGRGKPAVLADLDRIEGVYVPSLGERPVCRIWSKTDRIAGEPVTPALSHFGDMFLVEVGRGCGRGCLFCAAGTIYRPVRMRRTADVLKRCADFGKIGLVGTAVGDHPEILTMMDDLVRSGKSIGISSLRADQITVRTAELLVRGGLRSVAIAPETGSDKLRDRIGKGITREQVLDAVRIFAGAGIRTVKLYFMIGLPGETDNDIEAIVKLVDDLSVVRGKARLSAAVGPFVPKPHTPFQWCGFGERQVLRRRIKLLRRISRIRGCSLKVGSIDQAWVEAVLARGDRSLSAALLKAAGEGVPLKTVLRQGGIPHPATLDTRKPLPWDFIDCGVSKKRLLERYQRSGCT